jgi:tetratricopeptide (TPR) repeat protein
MKVVHLSKDKTPDDELLDSVKAYEKIIREHPTNAQAYDKLMIIYRKLKDYKKELRVINAAIKSFEETFEKKQPDFNQKVLSISKKLLKATGLADKKGNNIYLPGELAKWKKRKELVMKRVARTSK